MGSFSGAASNPHDHSNAPAKATEISPVRFVHITEKGAAVIARSGASIQCSEVTNRGITNRRHELLIQGVFSDAIRPCILMGVFAKDGRLFVCHLNVDVLLGESTLPPEFQASRVLVAYDPKNVAGALLRRAIAFAGSLGVPDTQFYMFGIITNQACGIGLDGKVYRLNTNVEFDRITCAPTASTQQNVLCGIRMLQFDERRVYNQRDHSNRAFDMQFEADHFVQHRSQHFDLNAVVAPARDEGAAFTVHDPTKDSTLTAQAAEIEKLIASRSFAAGAVFRTMILAAIPVILLRWVGLVSWPWLKTVEIALGAGFVIGFVARSWNYTLIMIREMTRRAR